MYGLLYAINVDTYTQIVKYMVNITGFMSMCAIILLKQYLETQHAGIFDNLQSDMWEESIYFVSTDSN